MPRVLLYVILFTFLGCHTSSPPDPENAQPVCAADPCPERWNAPRTLRVALYPHLPDAAGDLFETMENRIEREFERENPQVRLDLVINPARDFYDLETTLPSLLGPDGFDLVEIDTALLVPLQERLLIAPVELGETELGNFYPEARKSVTVGGQLYGIPTWRCSNFVFSRSKELAAAKNAKELGKVLQTRASNQAALIGDFAGSWTLPGLYLDALADGSAASDLTEEFRGLPQRAVREEVWKDLSPILTGCAMAGDNPCTVGAYGDPADPEAPARDFAAGKAVGLLGWSERLHDIEVSRQEERDRSVLYIGSAPLGKGSRPLVWVDALVLNRQRATTERTEDALTFARYLNRSETRVWIAMSHDAPQGTPPRYVLPATKDFYLRPEVQRDVYYSFFQSALEQGSIPSYPGFAKIRPVLQDELVQRLRSGAS